jgi:MoaA/NifB/PqqE/SkfB family radical SAM enzyme
LLFGRDDTTSWRVTTEEAEGVIRQLADAGAIILGLSGGEPMLRKDWRQLRPS